VTTDAALMYQDMVTRNASPEIVVSCEACGGSGCGACGGAPHACESCLGKEICKRLAEMAFKQDENGCWLEPVPEIRAAAANLLAWCPAPEPEPQPQPEPEIEGVEGEGVAPEDTTMNGNHAGGFITVAQPGQLAPVVPGAGNPAVFPGQPWSAPANPYIPTGIPMNPYATVPTESPEVPQPLAPVVSPSQMMAPPAPQTETPSAGMTQPLVPAGPPTFSGQIVAAQADQVAIQFDRTYRLPDGSRLMVASPNGTPIEMTVIASDVGVVMAQVQTPGISSIDLNGSTVEVGILAQ
jgi:hypothetical protein